MTDAGVEILHVLNSGSAEERAVRLKKNVDAFDTICNNFLRSRDATNN